MSDDLEFEIKLGSVDGLYSKLYVSLSVTAERAMLRLVTIDGRRDAGVVIGQAGLEQLREILRKLDGIIAGGRVKLTT